LRQGDNDVERSLWDELRGRRLNGLKFVRQLPIRHYFADFACREKSLVVEVDGYQHAGSSYDRLRDGAMSSDGWHVVRFWNGCVLRDRSSVLDTIVAIAEGRLTEPVLSPDLVFVPANGAHAGCATLLSGS
jgi:very-short-patch-repair endonuclease